MESSENRRQSDALPSINYMEFERAQREGAQFHQRHPSVARQSLSAASPISPTTMFGPGHTHPSYPSVTAPNGYHTPPDSRRTSDNNDQPQQSRQSLPSIHEVFVKPNSYSAPSPLQTPPVGGGSFSATRPSSRANSMPNSMPRSQPSESQPSSQGPPPPPPPPPQVAPPIYHPPPPPLHGPEPYPRSDSQGHSRTLPPNPYSQSQPPSSSIPATHPPENYAAPPPPPVSTQPHISQTYHTQTSYPAPHVHPVSSPPYPPQVTYPPPPPPPPSQYPPFSQPPGPQQAPYHPQSNPPPYGYAPREPGYGPHEHSPIPQPSPGNKGVKRSSGYGSAIERALSISAIRRDLEAIKEHSSRIYYIVQQYQEMSSGGGPANLSNLDMSLRDFNEALYRSCRNTEALQNCQAVFQDLSAKENAEQNALKMNAGPGSEYGDDGQGYTDETRSNGSHQEKKPRRGRAAPPGRCHSCHRAETPEWRRGPDGARTLCNACGLHYAKLTRKLSKNSIGSGPLGAGGRKPSSPLP